MYRERLNLRFSDRSLIDMYLADMIDRDIRARINVSGLIKKLLYDYYMQQERDRIEQNQSRKGA